MGIVDRVKGFISRGRNDRGGESSSSSSSSKNFTPAPRQSSTPASRAGLEGRASVPPSSGGGSSGGGSGGRRSGGGSSTPRGTPVGSSPEGTLVATREGTKTKVVPQSISPSGKTIVNQFSSSGGQSIPTTQREEFQQMSIADSAERNRPLTPEEAYTYSIQQQTGTDLASQSGRQFELARGSKAIQASLQADINQGSITVERAQQLYGQRFSILQQDLIKRDLGGASIGGMSTSQGAIFNILPTRNQELIAQTQSDVRSVELENRNLFQRSFDLRGSTGERALRATTQKGFEPGSLEFAQEFQGQKLGIERQRRGEAIASQLFLSIVPGGQVAGFLRAGRGVTTSKGILGGTDDLIRPIRYTGTINRGEVTQIRLVGRVDDDVVNFQNINLKGNFAAGRGFNVRTERVDSYGLSGFDSKRVISEVDEFKIVSEQVDTGTGRLISERGNIKLISEQDLSAAVIRGATISGRGKTTDINLITDRGIVFKQQDDFIQVVGGKAEPIIGRRGIEGFRVNQKDFVVDLYDITSQGDDTVKILQPANIRKIPLSLSFQEQQAISKALIAAPKSQPFKIPKTKDLSTSQVLGSYGVTSVLSGSSSRVSSQLVNQPNNLFGDFTRSFGETFKLQERSQTLRASTGTGGLDLRSRRTLSLQIGSLQSPSFSQRGSFTQDFERTIPLPRTRSGITQSQPQRTFFSQPNFQSLISTPKTNFRFGTISPAPFRPIPFRPIPPIGFPSLFLGSRRGLSSPIYGSFFPKYSPSLTSRTFNLFGKPSRRTLTGDVTPFERRYLLRKRKRRNVRNILGI